MRLHLRDLDRGRLLLNGRADARVEALELHLPVHLAQHVVLCVGRQRQESQSDPAREARRQRGPALAAVLHR